MSHHTHCWNCDKPVETYPDGTFQFLAIRGGIWPICKRCHVVEIPKVNKILGVAKQIKTLRQSNPTLDSNALRKAFG